MTECIEENLLNGKVTVISDDQLSWEARKTTEYKAEYGDCNCLCGWVDKYGWVLEAGCPVHDL